MLFHKNSEFYTDRILLTHPQTRSTGLLPLATTCTAVGGKIALYQCLDVDCE